MRGALLLAVVAAFAEGVRAGEPFQVTASTEPRGTVRETDPVQLTIQVSGSQSADVSVPRLPTMTNIRVASGPSTSRNTSFSFDGTSTRMASSVTLVYLLLPMGPGAAEIPAIEVRVGSASYTTQPIRLQVDTDGGSRAPSPRGAGVAPPQPGEEDDVFLRAEAGSTEVWAGEPLYFEVVLYSRVQISGFEWSDRPSLQGFWAEGIDVDPNAERRRAVVGNRDYNAYPVLRYMLVPTGAGDVTLGAFKAQLQARRRPRDFFSDFFAGGGDTILRRTDPLRVRVKPLPETGRPSGFGGAVGTFRLATSLDRKTAGVNDAVALKAVVEGEGFLKSVAPPALDAGPDFKVFDPKVSESTSVDGGKLRSRRTWEWVVVPLAPGERTVPALRFSCFEPKTGTYRELKSEPLPLLVQRGPAGPGAGVAQGEVRAQRREIQFIKLGGGPLAEARVPLQRRPIFLALLLAPAALSPLLIVLGRRRARLKLDTGLARSRAARGRSRKRLRAAERLLARPDSEGFHEEVARALVDFVADRFRRPPAGLTYDVAEEMLASRDVPPDVRRRFRACLETCDFARFVPESGGQERRVELLREASDLLDALSRTL